MKVSGDYGTGKKRFFSFRLMLWLCSRSYDTVKEHSVSDRYSLFLSFIGRRYLPRLEKEELAEVWKG